MGCSASKVLPEGPAREPLPQTKEAGQRWDTPRAAAAAAAAATKTAEFPLDATGTAAQGAAAQMPGSKTSSVPEVEQLGIRASPEQLRFSMFEVAS